MMTYRGFSFITLDRSTTLAIFAQATSVIIVIIIVRLRGTFTRGIFVLRWVINVVACQVVNSCRNKVNHSGPRARTRQNVRKRAMYRHGEASIEDRAIHAGSVEPILARKWVHPP